MRVPGRAEDGDAPLGGVRMQITTGYSGYAFPVANAALGREMAANGGLEWQLAHNYSVVPVRLDLYQRQAIAFKGRVEIESNLGWAREEDPAQHLTVTRRDILIPPSTGISVFLTPRICPPARPGDSVPLTVKIYQGDNTRPYYTEQFSVMHLEPAHVYSLLLTDDPRAVAVTGDTVNPGDERRLRLPNQILEGRQPPYIGIKTFNHYIIPVERGMFTGMPLAARDFVFVVADAGQAAMWPADEQQALLDFMLAGGYLCLYNASAGTQLAGTTIGTTRAVGRGMLLAEPGPLASARGRLTDWLEGELEELTLWSYGLAGESGLYLGGRTPPGTTVFGQLDFGEVFPGENVVSHQPDYLNPIWIYREACRSGMLQPWDYPEFTQQFELAHTATLHQGFSPLRQNANLAGVAEITERLALQVMAGLAQPQRQLPGGTLVLLALLAVVPLAALLARRARPLLRLALRLALLAVLLGGLAAWALERPAHTPAVALELIDADAAVPGATVRRLSVAPTDRSGSFSLPTSELLRYVRWSRPGSWTWTLPPATAAQSKDPAVLQGRQGGTFVAVASEGRGEVEQWPVSVRSRRSATGATVTVDTHALPADCAAVLLTPAGAEFIPAGTAAYELELALPLLSDQPGAGRLLAAQAAYSRSIAATAANAGGPQDPAATQWATAPLADTLLRTAALDPGTFGTDDPLAQLAWSGLLQPLGGARQFIGGQGVLLVRLPSEEAFTERFLRLTFPLDGTP